MNTNRIDKIGVAAVIDYFCRMGYIDPHINFDDKIPVWDGDIDIHKNIDSNSKDDIEFNLSVQVKSSEHKSNNFNTSINQSIDINDIELYKKKGGTLLIKVLVGKHKSQIYFAYLGKIEINKLLEQISETQKSKDVICQREPKDFTDLIPRLRTILTNKHFFIGDAKFNLPDTSFPEEKIIGVKSDIDFFEKLISFFELNNIDSHFDFKSLTEEDFRKLEFLVRLFNNESPKPIDGIKTPFTCFTIGKLNLCFAVNKIETGGFRLYDINSCSAYRVCEQTEERINFPIYSYLFSNGIFPDNLRYSNIVTEYQKYNIAEKNLNFVNFDILNLINEYDKSHKEIYLNSAKSIIEWLIQENKEENFTHIYKINLLQINYRMGIEMTKEDKDFLFFIQSKDNISFDFAASVILKETARAQSYFNRMTEDERNEIVQYPIYTLYEILINNNNAKTENAEP